MSLFSYSPSSSSKSSVTSVLLITLFLLVNTITSSHCLLQFWAPVVAAEAKNAAGCRPHRPLSVDYYSKTCPEVENLVFSVTSKQYKVAPVTAPATIRLFFHDCFVEGCDASILITSKPGSKELAEKDAPDNKDIPMEAFNLINTAKALVDSKCPQVVSCADILAIAARDFVHLTGGPHYEVKKGRWDGKISMASRVHGNLPQVNSTMDEIIKLFASKGLSVEDLVALLGAHTIGYSHCKHVKNRIYNYTGTKQPALNIDPRLLKALKMSCPNVGGSENTVVPFDVATPFSFDNAYYGNLENNLGLLVIDQALYLDLRTKPVVQTFAKDKLKFFQEFANAMEKMGSIGVKRGRKHGDKRKDCTLHV